MNKGNGVLKLIGLIITIVVITGGLVAYYHVGMAQASKEHQTYTDLRVENLKDDVKDDIKEVKDDIKEIRKSQTETAKSIGRIEAMLARRDR